MIDLTTVTSPERLHQLLASRLGFPSYYGRNWDAFDECIADPQQSDMPSRLLLVGYGIMQIRLPADANLLLQCLAESAPSTEVIFDDPTQ